MNETVRGTADIRASRLSVKVAEALHARAALRRLRQGETTGRADHRRTGDWGEPPKLR
ncbi:MAG: hypothetical protein V4449_00755 [Patescibacteria group bacterium]